MEDTMFHISSNLRRIAPCGDGVPFGPFFDRYSREVSHEMAEVALRFLRALSADPEKWKRRRPLCDRICHFGHADVTDTLLLLELHASI